MTYPAKASPRDRRPAGKSSAISKPKSAGVRPPDSVQSLRVLVVEDNPDTAESLARQLHLWGHQCQLCSRGEEALRALPRYHPQVVLIDIGLPDMDGWRLARLIRQSGDECPILIAVTAYGEEGDFARSQQAAISYHLVKPAYQPQLRQILGRIARQ
ncbi:MAG TPA: response regulator [Pirellulales bacterium]|nr:response regulator [Pirellulales bacterium]